MKFNFRSNNQQSDLKNDSFDTDIENIFSKLTDITMLNAKNFISNFNNTASYSNHDANNEATLTKMQSFILKNLIGLLPILLNSKRYSITKIRLILI